MDAKRLALSTLLLLVEAIAHGAIAVDGHAADGAGSPEMPGAFLTFGTLLGGNPNVTVDRIRLSLSASSDPDFTFYVLEEELGGAAGSVTWLPDGDDTRLFRQANLIGQDEGARLSPVRGSFDSGFQMGSFGGAGQPGSVGSSLGAWDVSKVVTTPRVTTPGGIGTIISGVNTGNGLDGVGDEMTDPQDPGLTLENAQLPEPSTLSIFGVGTACVALGALRRRFR